MNVKPATMDDYGSWLTLAGEVEDLFGPMVDEPGFQSALFLAISLGNAFCIRKASELSSGALPGGILISKEFNEIIWLAVSEACRGRGYGKLLLATALDNLSSSKAVSVQTFDKSVEEGRTARHLYQYFGFMDHRSAEVNAVGIPTVIMRRG